MSIHAQLGVVLRANGNEIQLHSNAQRPFVFNFRLQNERFWEFAVNSE